MLKLGTQVTEKSTELTGALTNMQIYSDGSTLYCFQPKGLGKENGLPLFPFWVTKDRIIGAIEIPDINLPKDVLGTEVEDIASGFKGIATALIYHLNGCVHFWVKSKGVAAKTGETIEECNFDIRRLVGDKVPKYTEEALETSKEKNPSPCPVPKCGPK